MLKIKRHGKGHQVGVKPTLVFPPSKRDRISDGRNFKFPPDVPQDSMRCEDCDRWERFQPYSNFGMCKALDYEVTEDTQKCFFGRGGNDEW